MEEVLDCNDEINDILLLEVIPVLGADETHADASRLQPLRRSRIRFKNFIIIILLASTVRYLIMLIRVNVCAGEDDKRPSLLMVYRTPHNFF